METMSETVEKTEAMRKFDEVVSQKKSKQAIKDFLLERATHYLGQHPKLTSTRKQRRLVAKQMAKRLTKQVMAGEDILNARV